MKFLKFILTFLNFSVLIIEKIHIILVFLIFKVYILNSKDNQDKIRSLLNGTEKILTKYTETNKVYFFKKEKSNFLKLLMLNYKY